MPKKRPSVFGEIGDRVARIASANDPACQESEQNTAHVLALAASRIDRELVVELGGAVHWSRVLGVVLSAASVDGIAGLIAIKGKRNLAPVQDPGRADAPGERSAA